MLAEGQLTKTFLMDLPAEVYLVSNLCKDLTPVFMESVSSVGSRSEQWERVEKSLAVDELCTVYASKRDYIKALEKMMLEVFKKVSNADSSEETLLTVTRAINKILTKNKE